MAANLVSTRVGEQTKEILCCSAHALIARSDILQHSEALVDGVQSAIV
jgi:hypothetical protein